MVENYLRATGFFHVSRIGIIRGFHLMLNALVERWRPETHSFVLPIGEVTVTLEDVAHIFCLLGSTLFTDKSTAYAHAKYLPLLRDFEQIHTYSWGAACLVHLYRALCRTSRYDTKEMDGPLNQLFVWA
ncbi:protein MAIN-LIKE 1-like [Arachis hypogaea]|uniref:protein MAIN-LIKE 1-like n=1 Tax=Arachis hypogaea TaxID=3818 RepID=UPI003B211CA4